MSDTITISEAAEILGVSAATLRRWDKDGKFISSRHPINKYRVYDKSRVEQFVRDMQLDYAPQYESPVLDEPYFSTDNGALFNIDALKLLNSLEPNSVDLIIADPPYNIKKTEWDLFPSQKEYLDWTSEWVNAAAKVLTPNGTMYICGFSEILADIKWVVKDMFHSCKWIVWYYRNKANLGNYWGRSHESLLHLRKGKSYVFNIDPARIPYNKHTVKYPERTQAQTSQYGNGKKKSYNWKPHPLGAKPKDVIELPTISNSAWEKTPHPTQKPVELIKKLLLSSSNEEKLVVDPFGGSGTTFIVAEAFNRRWVGSELSAEYCELIKERLQDGKQMKKVLESNLAADLDRRAKLRH